MATQGMAQALAVIGAIRTAHPTRYPNGKYGAVGYVPFAMTYRMRDGSPLTDDMARKIKAHGPGLFREQVQRVTYDSPDDVLAAIVAHGGTPCACCSFTTGNPNQ